MGKKIIVAFWMMSVLLCGCGGETKDILTDSEIQDVDEKKELEESMSLTKIRECFSNMENVSVSEIEGENTKILSISVYHSMSDESYQIGSDVASVVRGNMDEEWFDWDYIAVDFFNKGIGRLSSITGKIENGNYIGLQEHIWVEESSESDVNESVEIEKNDVSVLIYEDEKVKIFFGSIGERGVELWVENLTDVNITIQADTLSINGISTDRILMSDDVAPKSKGRVIAKCSDFAVGTKVETIGGQLTIIDFERSFDSYKATFVNVPVE